MNFKNALRVLSFLLGVAFIFLAFRKVNWPDFIGALRSIQVPWLVAAALAVVLSMCARSLRWHSITGLPASQRFNVWEAACIGYIGGVIYPARAGEVLRMLRLQKLTGLGGGLAIGSALIDRVFDGVALCCMLMVLLLEWNLSRRELHGVMVTIGVVLVVVLCVFVFIFRGRELKDFLRKFLKLGRIGTKLSRWYDECLNGLQILRSPSMIARTVGFQLIVSAGDILACAFLMAAFGWDLSWLVSILVLVYITAAVSVPSTPGYVGVYQVATVYALTPSGISASAAAAYGSVLQVMTLILFICVGIWAYLKKAPQ